MHLINQFLKVMVDFLNRLKVVMTKQQLPRGRS